MEKYIIQEALKNCPGMTYYPDSEKLDISGRSILKRLTGLLNSGKSVEIKWLYEEDDEAMLELGEHYRDSAGIPLKIEMVI